MSSRRGGRLKGGRPAASNDIGRRRARCQPRGRAGRSKGHWEQCQGTSSVRRGLMIGKNPVQCRVFGDGRYWARTSDLLLVSSTPGVIAIRRCSPNTADLAYLSGGGESYVVVGGGRCFPHAFPGCASWVGQSSESRSAARSIGPKAASRSRLAASACSRARKRWTYMSQVVFVLACPSCRETNSTSAP